MNYYYSNSTNSFYNDAVNTYIPPDAVEISTDTYSTLMNGQSQGMVITSLDGTNPTLANAIIFDQAIRIIASYAFLNRFQPTERAAITIAAIQGLQESPPDPTLAIFLDDMGAAIEIDLDDPTVGNAMNALVEYGLITSDRVPEMLANGAPFETVLAPISTNN